jgi:hypothetical protein
MPIPSVLRPALYPVADVHIESRLHLLIDNDLAGSWRALSVDHFNRPTEPLARLVTHEL